MKRTKRSVPPKKKLNPDTATLAELKAELAIIDRQIEARKRFLQRKTGRKKHRRETVAGKQPRKLPDLMTDDELLAAAAPLVRQLLHRDLMRGTLNPDDETFTVLLASPDNKALAAQLAEDLRSLPPMPSFKDKTKH
ncbi:MAG: hypothetical protein ACRD3O_00130 [Terriglobia bacterium]